MNKTDTNVRGGGFFRGRGGGSSIVSEEPRKCYTCGGISHFAKFCATKGEITEHSMDCFRCGGKGHGSRFCATTPGQGLERQQQAATTAIHHAPAAASTNIPNTTLQSIMATTASKPVSVGLHNMVVEGIDSTNMLMMESTIVASSTAPSGDPPIIRTFGDILNPSVADPLINLFWVIIQVQQQVLWALVDTGSSKNLIQASRFEALEDKPEIYQKPELW